MLQSVVKLAAESGTPIVPRGGGTGVMGAALPVQGGIVLDLKRLNAILDIDPQSRMVQVEAGAILEDVNRALHSHDLMLGHDPWSVPIATIGGTISTNGVGYLAAANGPMGEQVLGLEAVLPTGQLLEHAPRPQVLGRTQPQPPVHRGGGSVRRHYTSQPEGSNGPGSPVIHRLQVLHIRPRV